MMDRIITLLAIGVMGCGGGELSEPRIPRGLPHVPRAAVEWLHYTQATDGVEPVDRYVLTHDGLLYVHAYQSPRYTVVRVQADDARLILSLVEDQGSCSLTYPKDDYVSLRTELSDARAGTSPVRGAEACARMEQLVPIVQRLNAAAERCSGSSTSLGCVVHESGFFDPR